MMREIGRDGQRKDSSMNDLPQPLHDASDTEVSDDVMEALKRRLEELPNVSGVFMGTFNRMTEYYSVPVNTLPQMITDYVAHIETAPTKLSGCDCEWHIHPEDVDKPEGERRVRPGAANPLCPVHTKEGFLFGFFKWAFAEPTDENGCYIAPDGECVSEGPCLCTPKESSDAPE